MTRAFFGTFIIQHQDTSMIRSRSDHIITRLPGIGSNNRTDQTALAEFTEGNSILSVFIGHDGTHRAESFYIMGF